MMSIGQAVADLGISQHDGEDIVLTLINGDTVDNYLLSEVADWDIDIQGNLYIASGAFRRGSVTRRKGRSGENVERVYWMPFDSDLKDYLALPLEDVLALEDAEIASHVGRMRADVEENFRVLGLPIHRIDFTGHGLCTYIYLDEEAQVAVNRVGGVQKALIERINGLAGFHLVDPAVSDPGPRITRLPGSINRKPEQFGIDRTRQTSTLFRRIGFATPRELGLVARAEQRPPARIIPDHGKRLEDAAVSRIVTAVAPHWTLGQKHNVGLALAGMLAKAGVPEEQAQAIIGQLSVNDTKPWDRVKAVSDSYNRIRSGLDVKGFMGLADYLPADVSHDVDEALRPLREATAPVLTIGQGAAKSDDPIVDFQPVPEAAIYGWLRDYVDLMLPTTEAPAAFHVGVGLTLAGATLGRHVGARYGADPLYANLYTLLVGRSGKSRKDTSIKRGTRLLTESLPDGSTNRTINSEVKVRTDIGSAEGLIQTLQAHANTLLYISEFSKLMGNARRKATTTIIPLMIEAFDTPMVLESVTKNNALEAKFPYLSLLAATQPDILANLMQDEDIHSGFANRFLYVCGDGTGPMPLPPALDKRKAGAVYARLYDHIRTYAEGELLEITPAGQALWNDWYIRDYRSEGATPEEDAMGVRHAVLIQKVALIHAVGEGARQIDVPHLEAAIALIEWMWTHVRVLLGTWGGGLDAAIEQRIRQVLTKKGAMKRRDLHQQCTSRKWGAREFGQVLDALIKSGIVVVDMTGVLMLADRLEG